VFPVPAIVPPVSTTGTLEVLLPAKAMASAAVLPTLTARAAIFAERAGFTRLVGRGAWPAAAGRPGVGIERRASVPVLMTARGA
jgi:hypothetical protein